jgi:hypothetical protein
MMATPVSTGHANYCVQRRQKPSKERAAAGTTGSSRKTAAVERQLAEKARRQKRRLPKSMRMARQRQSHLLKACLARRRGRSFVTLKRLPWRGCSPGVEGSNRAPNLVRPGKGCKAGAERDKDKPRRAIGALQSAHEMVWTNASGLSYDDSRTARCGQEDA